MKVAPKNVFTCVTMYIVSLSQPVVVLVASVKIIDSAGLSASNMRARISTLQWNIPSDTVWAGLKCLFLRAMCKCVAYADGFAASL